MKLPHQKEDIVAKRYLEPIYKALFEVRVQFPAAVDDAQRELALDNIIGVSGLTTEKLPGIVQQKFRGTTRSFAGAVVDDTSHDITITMNINLDDSNSMYSYKLFKQWSDIIYNTNTGERGLAAEYKTGSMTVTLYNKSGQVFRTYKAVDIFISEPITALDDFNYETNDIVEPISIIFKCDRVDVIDN